jgi:F-type H+-transporting ATPase subunit epsilon
MTDKLHFSLVSPAREVFAGEVDHVIAPGTEGDFGVLPKHAPFMSTLKNGVVRVLEGDEVAMRVFVRGGFADVTPDGLTILAEEAVNLADVDASAVSDRLQTARETAQAEPDNMVAADRVAFLEALQGAVAN